METLHSENASRQINGQAVFQAIVNADAPVSRAELSRALGLSKQTLSEIVALLEQTHWIREAGRKKGALGRAATSYELNPEAGYVIGVTLEDGHYTMGLATMRGSIKAKKACPIAKAQITNSEALGKQLLELLAQLIDEAAIDAQLIRCCVVGCPGVVEPVGMRVHHSPNLPSLQDCDLRALISQRLGIPVYLDNDLNLHAYGEYRFGCSQNTRSSVFIGLSADIGIGMGIMLGDTIWAGSRGWAGEIGYMPVHRKPLNSQERARGALELSLNQYQLHASAAGKRLAAPSTEVVEKMEALATECAYAISVVLCVLDPELVILGGSLGENPQLQKLVSSKLQAFSTNPISVRKGSLGQEAGLLGAIAMALQRTMSLLFHSGHP